VAALYLYSAKMLVSICSKLPKWSTKLQLINCCGESLYMDKVWACFMQMS